MTDSDFARKLMVRLLYIDFNNLTLLKRELSLNDIVKDLLHRYAQFIDTLKCNL